MTRQQHSQTKNSQKQTSTFSSASTGGMFESRPFVVQASRGENVQQPDLKTSLMQVERYGHHLNRMQPFGNEATIAVQPKMETGQPIQCARRFNFSRLFRGRPSKPRPVAGQPNPGLQQTNPTTGTPLTAHHKYGLQNINQDLQHSNVLGHPNPNTTTQGQNMLNWADPTNSKPPLTHSDVAWTPHNIFMGPNPQDRLDDPGNKTTGALYPHLDTHFTASGTVTPASGLALDIHKAGGIGNFNPADLTNRLNALPNPNKASSYNPNEWIEPTPGKFQQAGMPNGWHTNMDINQRINYAKQSQIDSSNRALFKFLPFS
ncbi:MAG: hypothetical protein V7L04_25460 [Nostoc sp.]|uniref:hypothetical protein n=1 Tax=Nostoc sp. TaxID=1180 RepID=UPI002FF98ABF